MFKLFSYLLPRNMFYFAPDDGSGGGAGGDKPPAEDTPKESETPDDSTVEDEPETEEDDSDKDDITLSQDALSKRLSRKEKQARKALFDKFDVKTEKELETKLSVGQKAIDAALSDDERRDKQSTEATEARVAAETERDDALKVALSANMRADALSLMAGRFVDPATAFLLLDVADIDMTSSDFDGLADAIKGLEETSPWALLPEADRKVRKKSDNPDPTPNPASGSETTKETEDDKRARYFGRGKPSFFDLPEAGDGVQYATEDQKASAK